MDTIPAERITNPVPVEIKNWAPTVKPRLVKNTTVNTFIVDPAGTADKRQAQIAAMEPNRVRMAVQVLDVAVGLTVDARPNTSPDASTAASAPASGGIVLPPNAAGPFYEFYGPDAMFINSLAAVGRVTVIKEYC